jgi:hypothetical protein
MHTDGRTRSLARADKERHTPYLPQRIVTLVRHYSPGLKAQQLAWANIRAI